MNIGLVDADGGSFPNLALMKLASYHKAQGDKVFLATLEDIEMGNLFVEFDKFYVACVFSWNYPKVEKIKNLPNVEVGGIGISSTKTLPDEIEHMMPYYELFGIRDTAYGFLSRGCPRQCPFCVVAGKEGIVSHKVADLSEWWSGQKNIVLCDPNILACKEHMDLLEQLRQSHAQIDINQGLDIRLLNRDNIELINSLNIKRIHFAWDNPKQDLRKHFEFYKEYGILKNYRKLVVYVLVNYWSSFEEDLERIYWLRDNGFDPYVMIYDKQNAERRIKRLGRYVNNKFIFRSCEKFEDYQ